MLDALLETIGTIAVLASIAAKCVYFRSAPRATDDAAADAGADSTDSTDSTDSADSTDSIRSVESATGSRPVPGRRRGAALIARCKR